jgi:hypothetical protein
MERDKQVEGEPNAYRYSAFVSAHRLASDFTPRVIPVIRGVSAPLEISNITWQH